MDIRRIKGIGDKTACLLEKLNIENTEDLIRYYPRDFVVFDQISSVSSVKIDKMNSIKCVIKGSISLRYMRGMSLISFNAADASGEIKVSIFNEPYMKKNLKPGIFYVFRGIVHKKGHICVIDQPQCFKPDEYDKMIGIMQPVYRITKGISNRTITGYVRKAFDIEKIKENESSVKQSEFDEFLPDEIIRKNMLCSHGDAVWSMHFPQNMDDVIKARRRLVYEEFLIFIINIRMYREKTGEIPNSYPMIPVSETRRLIERLPYRLTDDQEKTWHDIESDMSGESCMNRLIQGDVGSGKTILAILALVMTAANGHQGSMMAPTEVLAEQHFKLISEMTRRYNLPLRPVLLTGAQSVSAKRDIYEKMKDGTYNVIIGTNALIQEKAVYSDLALAITDEQHRFGVRQRVGLSEKGSSPHIMVMSATPIPRTLAMIIYGDLQISVIKQMPAGRKPVKNAVVSTEYREKIYKMIIKQVEEGHQAYVICPMIGDEETENFDSAGLECVKDYTEKLRSKFPESIRVDSLNGHMKASEKNRIMEGFASGDIDVLVSTTVIEVGVNVPNATIMLIENAERFGLAQLHQLRGRVGRGNDQSYCIFVNTSDNEDAAERLKIMTKTNDGFRIASEDMKRRGPGDIFGIRQSGDALFRLGDIYQDSDILEMADRDAADILKNDPCHDSSKYRCLMDKAAAVREGSMDMRSI